MVSEQITIWGIGILLAFFIPIVISNRIIGLNINKEMIISVARMIVQLLLVGIYLQFLFQWNYAWLNILYIGIMVIVSAMTIIKSCKLKKSRFFLLLFAGIGIPLFASVFLLTGVVLQIDNMFDARYTITLSGMLLGNCMRSIIISFNTFYNDMRENEDTYLLYLSLGASRAQAVKPTIIKAMEAALKPAIATMMTIGLVSLPGMMTGQMLGGSLPLTAIAYQIIIMAAIFILQYTGISVMLRIAVNISFTKRDMLRKDIFAKNN
ncbi:MAG: ABC transporter permease [Clostridia bacterium]|nr:ABC transporter permease [Clostridia bacterium]